MTLLEGILASGLRAVLVALMAWSAARVLVRTCTRPVILVPLLALLLTPSLVVAYAWSGVLAWTAPGSLWRHLICIVLTGSKLLPIAVAVLYFCPPPPLSGTASHCLGLVPRTSPWLHRWWRLTLGNGRRHVLALAVVFLFAFQEFELSSLLMLPAWTVWLFDAQAGGAPLGETLGNSVIPVCIEGLVIAAGLYLLLARHADSEGAQPPANPGPLTWSVLLVPVCIGSLFPLAFALRDTATGIRAVLTDGRLLHELVVSLAVSTVATLAAMLLAGAILRNTRWLWPWCLPGLLGSLVVGLVLQGLFQLPGLVVVYDTALPLVLALTLVLLPVAVVLRSVLGDLRANPSLHSAVLLQRAATEPQRRSGRLLLASLVGKRRLAAALILFLLVYFEVVASALLAPVHMTPASVRLMNLMHYGQSAVLSGMVTLMILCLVIPLGLAWALYAFLARRHVRLAHG